MVEKLKQMRTTVMNSLNYISSKILSSESIPNDLILEANKLMNDYNELLKSQSDSDETFMID